MKSPKFTINNLALGAGIGIFGKFLGRLLSVVGDVIAARVLGPALFGLYSIGWTIFRLIEIIAPLGMDRGVLHFIPQFAGKDTGRLKGTIIQSLLFTFFSGLVFSFIFFFGSDWLAYSVFKKPDLAYIIKFLSIGFPFGALLSVVASITRAVHSVKYAVFIQDIGQPILSLSLLIVLLYYGEVLRGILFADVFSYFLAVVWGGFYIRRLYPATFAESCKSQVVVVHELVRYSTPVAFGSVFSMLLYSVDRFFVGYFLPEINSGIYQAASQFSLIFAVILSGLSTVLAPLFSNLYHQNNLLDLKRAYKIGNKWGIYLGLPVFIVIFTAPQLVLQVLFGNEYSSGWLVMMILVGSQFINLITGASGSLLVMSGGQQIWFRMTAVALFVNMLLNYYLTPTMGILGTAIGTSISASSLYLSTLLGAWFRFNVWPYDIRYLKGLIASIAAGVFSWSINILLPANLWALVIQGVVVLIGFGGTLILLRLDDEDLEFVTLVRMRFIKLIGVNNEGKQL